MDLEKEAILISPAQARELAQNFADEKLEEFLVLINEKITEAAGSGELYIILDSEDLIGVLEDEDNDIPEEWIEALRQKGYYVLNPYYNNCGYGPYLLISWEDKPGKELDEDWKYSFLDVDTVNEIVNRPIYRSIIDAAGKGQKSLLIPSEAIDLCSGETLRRLSNNGFNVRMYDHRDGRIDFENYQDPEDAMDIVGKIVITWN